MNVGESLLKLCQDSGIAALIQDPKPLIMIAIACTLLYLGIVRGYEPLLMIPIAFGMLLTNLPFGELYHEELFARRPCQLEPLRRRSLLILPSWQI